MGQFADDLWTTSPAKSSSINAMLQELEDFGSFSGLTINVEKTAVLWVRPWRNFEAKFYTLKKLFWSPSAIKILGIMIFSDVETPIKENYYKILEKVNEVIDSWLHKDLDLMGKITIVNSLLNSLATHGLLSLPSAPKRFLDEYRRTIFDFLWNHKPAKIAYHKLIHNYENLGLRLNALATKHLALKASWPHRMNLKEKISNEYDWFYTTLPIKDSRIWYCNLKPEDILIDSNSIAAAKSIFKAWCHYNFQEVLASPEEILDTIIWGNSLIRKNNKPIFTPSIVNSNIDKILDIYNLEKHKFFTYQEIIDSFGHCISFLRLGVTIISRKCWPLQRKYLIP